MSEKDISITPTQDPNWMMLAEFILPGKPELIDQEANGIELVSSAVKRLGLPDNQLILLQEAVEGAVASVRDRHNFGCEEIPPTLRVLLANSAAVEALATQEKNFPANEKSFRGWGFFLVERVEDGSQPPARPPCLSIDVYLYQEGETEEGRGS
jgi:hypothetical protein